MAASWSLAFSLLFFLFAGAVRVGRSSDRSCEPQPPPIPVPVFPLDVDLLQFALNLEHLECDFFLISALGCGLDCVDQALTNGGPPPIGGRKAKLSSKIHDIMKEFGYQEVGHLRAIKSLVGEFPRPLLNLSASNFANAVDEAFGYKLDPPFDPYSSNIHYLLAAYFIPYMGLVGYVGANPLTNGYVSKGLLAGLLGVEAGQDAIIRGLLQERRKELVSPYKITVAEFTGRISELRNRLAGCGVRDEGIVVPIELGAEMRTTTNTISANRDSLSYDRTPAQILRVVYGTGDEHRPGGFFPMGANGKIAKEYLKSPY